jgi:hypothetical protein
MLVFGRRNSVSVSGGRCAGIATWRVDRDARHYASGSLCSVYVLQCAGAHPSARAAHLGAQAAHVIARPRMSWPRP